MLPRDIYMSFGEGCLYHKEMMEIENTNVTETLRTFVHRATSATLSMDMEGRRKVVFRVVGRPFYFTYTKTHGLRMPESIYTDRWNVAVIPNIDARTGSFGIPHLVADKPYFFNLVEGNIEEIENDLVLLKFKIGDFVSLLESAE